MQAQAQEIEKKPMRKPFKPGRNGNLLLRTEPGFQNIKDRLAFWFERKTIGEINKLCKSKREWNKLPAIDAHICRIAHQGSKDSGLEYSAFLFAYLYGKPTQPLSGEDGKPLIPQVDVMEIARRMAFVLELAKQQQIAGPIIDQSISCVESKREGEENI
jgi:hypothetical protein